MFRIIISSIILALGIAGAVFVIQNPVISSNAPQNQLAQAQQNNNIVSNKPFAEQLKTEISQNSQDLENITQSFTQNLVSRIQLENPDGPAILDDGKGLNVPNPDEIALELMADAASKFDFKKLIPKIKDEDLKISEENKADTLLAYAKNFDEIIKKSKEELSGVAGNEEFTEENLNVTISAYENAIKSLYQLTVPRMMIDFHKTEIAYLSAELSLFEKIKNAQQDPMAAILAGENIPLLEQELVKQMNLKLQEVAKAFKSQKQ